MLLITPFMSILIAFKHFSLAMSSSSSLPLQQSTMQRGRRTTKKFEFPRILHSKTNKSRNSKSSKTSKRSNSKSDNNNNGSNRASFFLFLTGKPGEITEDEINLIENLIITAYDESSPSQELASATINRDALGSYDDLVGSVQRTFTLLIESVCELCSNNDDDDFIKLFDYDGRARMTSERKLMKNGEDKFSKSSKSQELQIDDDDATTTSTTIDTSEVETKIDNGSGSKSTKSAKSSMDTSSTTAVIETMIESGSGSKSAKSSKSSKGKSRKKKTSAEDFRSISGGSRSSKRSKRSKGRSKIRSKSASGGGPTVEDFVSLLNELIQNNNNAVVTRDRQRDLQAITDDDDVPAIPITSITEVVDAIDLLQTECPALGETNRDETATTTGIISINVQGDLEAATGDQIRILEDTFINTYNQENAFSADVCDPFFRVMTNVVADVNFASSRRRLQQRRNILSQTNNFASTKHTQEQHRQLNNNQFFTIGMSYSVSYNGDAGCAGIDTIFDESYVEIQDGDSRRNLQEDDRLCLCPLFAFRRAPSNDVFTESIDNAIQELNNDGLLDFIQGVSGTNDVVPVACSDEINTFTSMVSVQLEFSSSGVDPTELGEVASAFVGSYNTAQNQFCDPLFRRATESIVMSDNTTSATRHLQRVPSPPTSPTNSPTSAPIRGFATLLVTGECRGCEEDSDLFDDVSDRSIRYLGAEVAIDFDGYQNDLMTTVSPIVGNGSLTVISSSKRSLQATTSSDPCFCPNDAEERAATVEEVFDVYEEDIANLELETIFQLTNLTSSATDSLPGRLTVYYDFEGPFDVNELGMQFQRRFREFSNVGVQQDDLGLLGNGFADTSTADVPLNAKGSTSCYVFSATAQGTNDYRLKTNSFSADLTSTNQYTIMFWFKNQGSFNKALATVRYDSNFILLQDRGWQIQGFFSDDASPSLQFPNFIGPGAVGAADGQWHHVAYVVSNMGGPNDLAYIETFVDGISVGIEENEAFTNTDNFQNREGALLLGGDNDNTASTVNGRMDDFAAFDGIIDAATIARVASGDLGPEDWLPTPAPTSGGELLIVYYDFEVLFNEFPNVGVQRDNLLVVGAAARLDTDVPPNAVGSTQSYAFNQATDGDSRVATASFSADLTSTNQYTIMFWFRGTNEAQELENTRLATVRYDATFTETIGEGWQIEGFGDNDLGPDLRFPGGFIGPDAIGTLDDQWHHIAYVVSNVDGPNGFAYVETFVDGNSVGLVEDEASTDTDNFKNTRGILILGGHNEARRSATGKMDDFAIFDGIVDANTISSIANGDLSPSNLA